MEIVYPLMGAPAKTPVSLVKLSNARIVSALQEPDVRRSLSDPGMCPIGSSSEEFGRFLEQDRPKWDKIIRAANIRLG